jgi:hypothetical protein
VTPSDRSRPDRRRRHETAAPAPTATPRPQSRRSTRAIRWIQAKQEAEAKKIHKLPSRRKTKSLASWAPVKEVPTSVAPTSSDPDPPLIA